MSKKGSGGKHLVEATLNIVHFTAFQRKYGQNMGKRTVTLTLEDLRVNSRTSPRPSAFFEPC